MIGGFGLKGGLVVALGLALAVPAAGCKKKKTDDSEEKDSKKKKSSDDDDDKDSKKKKKSSDDDDDKDSKKKKKSDDDDDDKSAKKKKSDDDDDKSAKKAKAPKSVDEDDGGDEEEPKKKKPLKPWKGEGSQDISGDFAVSGKNQDGKKYSGTLKLSRIGGNTSMMYKLVYKIAGETQNAVGFRDGNVLSCGWSTKDDFGVVAYLVKPDSKVLDGVWFMSEDTSIGTEWLTGPLTKDRVAGLYTIDSKKSHDKNKKTYGGTVDISIYKSGVYKMIWKAGGQTLRGLGLRSHHFPGTDTDVLSAGFDDDGDTGVLQYVIYDNGQTMKGHWGITGASGGEPTWGAETVTLK
ncbi:MAG: hypothetical protein ACXVEF_03365 [Polyangiales bacterium]